MSEGESDPVKVLYEAALGVYSKTNMTGSVLLYTLTTPHGERIFYYEDTTFNRYNAGFISYKGECFHLQF